MAARTGAENGEDLAALIAALPQGALGVDLDPGALIVARDSKIQAVGTPENPVIFTNTDDDNIGGNPERQVIVERFALGKPDIVGQSGPKTLEQVGHIIGVTKERVRQIQNNALKKIRLTLENRYLAA